MLISRSRWWPPDRNACLRVAASTRSRHCFSSSCCALWWTQYPFCPQRSDASHPNKELSRSAPRLWCIDCWDLFPGPWCSAPSSTDPVPFGRQIVAKWVIVLHMTTSRSAKQWSVCASPTSAWLYVQQRLLGGSTSQSKRWFLRLKPNQLTTILASIHHKFLSSFSVNFHLLNSERNWESASQPTKYGAFWRKGPGILNPEMITQAINTRVGQLKYQISDLVDKEWCADSKNMHFEKCLVASESVLKSLMAINMEQRH